MSAAWSLYNLTTAASGSVSDYFGFSDPVLELVNQDVSSLTLERSGSLDDPWQFQEGDRILLKRDGVVWFAGTCLPGAMNGSPNSESASYRIVDDAHAMSKTVYRQHWTGNIATIGASGATGGYWSGHLMLNYAQASGWLTTRGQVLDLLNYATRTPTSGASAGCSMPFDWDETEFPNQIVWQEEVRNVVVLEALRKQLKFFPQAAVYFDYTAASATGRPRLHCKVYADQASVTVPLAASAGDSTHEGVTVARVWEQEVPAVHILYEIAGVATIGDKTRNYLTLVQDIAPKGDSGFTVGTLHSNVSLMGAASTSIKQTIYTRPFNAKAGGGDAASGNADRVAWWKRHVPTLGDASSLAITGVQYMQRDASGDWEVAPSGLSPLPNELADGTWSDWMPIAGGGGTPSTCYELGVSGTVHYIRDSAANAGMDGDKQAIPYWGVVNLTDVYGGEGGTDYTVQTSFEANEPVPVGLADYVYQALKGPLFSGSVSYVAQECDGLGGILGLGVKVNLEMRNASGAPDTTNSDYALWRGMNMTVQKIRYEIETGKTTVHFGPPKHLGVPDLIDLLRQGRFRQKWTNSSLLAGGDLSQASVQAGDRVFKEGAHGGTPTVYKGEVVGPAATGTNITGMITFDGGT